MGEWDVRGMLRRMSWRQMQDWMDYFEREPWGVTVDDSRAAMITAAIYNTDQRRKGNARARDFMPRRRRQTAAEQKSILRAATGAK